MIGMTGALPAKAAGVVLTNTVLVQEKTVAKDGTTRVALNPARRAVPGDRIIYRIAYRNEVGKPVTGLVVSNPVPAALLYRGPAEGSPAPEVSADGRRFAALSALTVRDASGRDRAATAQDVRAVRWQAAAIPAGAAGQYAFEATLK
jgi:uncharacterized repeat protein (TIGR01451 family)